MYDKHHITALSFKGIEIFGKFPKTDHNAEYGKEQNTFYPKFFLL
jgi:hypothetical protein